MKLKQWLNESPVINTMGLEKEATENILKAIKDRRKIPMQQVQGCEDCEWAPYCNGSCPGLAHTMTGDFNRANPHDCYKNFLNKTGLTSSTVPWKTT